MIRIELKRAQQTAFRRFEFAGTVVGDAEVDTRCTEFRCHLDDRFQRLDPLLEGTLFEKSQGAVIVDPYVIVYPRVFSNRKPDSILDGDPRHRRLRGFCRGARGQDNSDEQQRNKACCDP